MAIVPGGFFPCLFTNLLFGERLLNMCADQETCPELTGWVLGGQAAVWDDAPPLKKLRRES